MLLESPPTIINIEFDFSGFPVPPLKCQLHMLDFRTLGKYHPMKLDTAPHID
jgi:hypothetical protein